jgi:hypothetical protein
MGKIYSEKTGLKLDCPSCQRDFKPKLALFCCNCKKMTRHYDPTANRLNNGNGYYQCSDCGCETSIESSEQERKRFAKNPDNYVCPESY